MIAWRKIDWTTTLFLLLTPVAAAVLVPLYVRAEGWDFRQLGLVVVFWALTCMAITAGYHRCLSHRSYEASPWLKFAYLIFGAAAFQGSALKWGSDHRIHHKFVDTDRDPYSIKKGFWYAHIGWLFVKPEPGYEKNFAPDLAQDRWVAFQHRYYGVIAILAGFGLPWLAGLALGMPWGGLVFGGFVRIVLSHHCTFFINSLCHTWGRQPYSDAHTARDSILMAVLTFGEGYHNFHHEFQLDYRNGVRWYQWDPTKWWIAFCSAIGSARKLKTISREAILRATLSMDEKRLERRGLADERLAALKSRVLAAQEDVKRRRAEWLSARQEFQRSSSARVLKMKADLRCAQVEFKKSLAQWRISVKLLMSIRPELAR